jgi:ABC-type polysaccharide/polyol phosphate export permease
MNIKQFEHVPLGLLWSLFPIVMWIAFFVLPGGAKKQDAKQNRIDKIISLILGLIVIGFVGWEIYQYVRTH